MPRRFRQYDGDGVCGDVDACPGTTVPEGVPTEKLGVNRFALVDGDATFDTLKPRARGRSVEFTLEDTAGCSCEQIIDQLHLGRGHRKFGCSLGAMRDWVGRQSQSGGHKHENHGHENHGHEKRACGPHGPGGHLSEQNAGSTSESGSSVKRGRRR